MKYLNDKELVEMYREDLYYERHTGALKWGKRGAGRTYGKLIGSTIPTGYKNTQVNGIKSSVHRVIFLLENGYEPDQVDHIDGNPRNNHHSNLRDGDNNVNAKNRKRPRNNTSGFIGVNRADNKWRSKIQTGVRDGKKVVEASPRCSTPREASAWRAIYQKLFWGDCGREVGDGVPMYLDDVIVWTGWKLRIEVKEEDNNDESQ